MNVNTAIRATARAAEKAARYACYSSELQAIIAAMVALHGDQHVLVDHCEGDLFITLEIVGNGGFPGHVFKVWENPLEFAVIK